MEFKSYGHLYTCKPGGWFNADESIIVKLKCAPKADCDDHQRQSTTFAVEERAKKGHQFIAKFVDSIEGVIVDGKPITNFDDLFVSGPADLYDWIYTAVLSQKILTETEIKN